MRNAMTAAAAALALVLAAKLPIAAGQFFEACKLNNTRTLHTPDVSLFFGGKRLIEIYKFEIINGKAPTTLTTFRSTALYR